MSTESEEARADFRLAMRDPHNLIRIHKDSSGSKGRRHREPTLNRAVVVLTVAAWQAFAHGTTLAILKSLTVPKGKPGHPLFNLTKANVGSSLRKFNTPNAYISLGLFGDVGFDPTPAWSFTIGKPARKYSVKTVKSEIDDWVRIRHKIAHGEPLPPVALISGKTKSGLSLHRKDAERCIEFFEAVVKATADEAHLQFP